MSVLFAILLFSILIFVHELGHFVAAKLSGVQVNEFSIFMGPAIFKKQVGETLYAVRCIPIGGYCAMEGENGDSDSPRSFTAAAWWKRFLILAAGAAMNFVAGLLMLALVMGSANYFALPVIDSFAPGCTLNGENGLREGDRILRLDGEAIYVESDFSLLLSVHPGTVHDLVVERDGEKVVLDDFVMEKHDFVEEDGTVSHRYGFSFRVTEATPGLKLRHVWYQAVDTVRCVRLSLQMLLSGQAGMKDVSGPVGIVQQISQTTAASETAVDALLNLLSFGSFIAINLAVMNLLPLPALDGGRIVCLLLTTGAEAVTGKKLNPKYEAYLHAAGMVVLLVFMAVVTFKDVFVIFQR